MRMASRGCLVACTTRVCESQAINSVVFRTAFIYTSHRCVPLINSRRCIPKIGEGRICPYGVSLVCGDIFTSRRGAGRGPGESTDDEEPDVVKRKRKTDAEGPSKDEREEEYRFTDPADGRFRDDSKVGKSRGKWGGFWGAIWGKGRQNIEDTSITGNNVGAEDANVEIQSAADTLSDGMEIGDGINEIELMDERENDSGKDEQKTIEEKSDKSIRQVISAFWSSLRGTKERTTPANQSEEDLLWLGSDDWNLQWRDLLDPTVENVLALILTAFFALAALQITWQLALVGIAIILSALKYTILAALLVGLLVFLL